MSSTATPIVERRAVDPTDVTGALILAALLLTAAAPYFKLSLGGEHITGDARQQVWTLWTLLDARYFPPDLFSTYMLDKTMPDAFVRTVEVLSRMVGAPEPVFAWLGVLSLVTTGMLAWRSARELGGAAASWAAVVLVFSIDAIAERTAGGLPRSVGMPITFLAVYGFVTLRPAATAAASVLGGLFWYPAGVIAGALFLLQMMAPASWFGRVQSASLVRRVSLIVIVGIATALPVLPEIVAPSRYGDLIVAGHPDWPEAGAGGRFLQDHTMGAINAPQPAHILVARAAGTLSSRVGSWRPHTTAWARISRAFGLAFFAIIASVLTRHMVADVRARRLLAVLLVGLTLYLIAFAAAPLLYIPERYLSYSWAAFAVIAAPYAAIVAATRMRSSSGRTLSAAAAVALFTTAIVAFSGGRLTSQGLGVHPGPMERGVLAFLKGTPPGALIAGWPSGVIENVPYFAHRPILLSYEMHFPWHEGYAHEMRERAEALIAAWYATDAAGIDDLYRRYGVKYFVVDKTLLPNHADYFRPYDRSIDEARRSLGGSKPFVASADPNRIVFENADYLVLALEGAA